MVKMSAPLIAAFATTALAALAHPGGLPPVVYALPLIAAGGFTLIARANALREQRERSRVRVVARPRDRR